MRDSAKITGEMLHKFAIELAKPYRSITGEGVRETLHLIQKGLPIRIYSVKSGTKAFDWTIPQEWNISDAYILGPDGKKIVDFKKNYLHVLGYSIPVDKEVQLDELQEHLYSLPDQPEAIPYVTSYYTPRWGFCLTERDRTSLTQGIYRVVIKSSLRKGALNYGELIIKGKSKKEVLLSCYLCHPQMANDSISGITMAYHLAKWLMQEKRRYTYRIVFIPETIGSLAYMSKNLRVMRKNTVAGYILTCVGDEGGYSFMPSRRGDSLADRAALNILRHGHPEFKTYTYALHRGSDERQYCAPGADLPVATVMRSRYGSFPEYHTSLDTFDFVTPKGLAGAFDIYTEIINTLENNDTYSSTVIGEPQLGRRGLFRTLTGKAEMSKADLYLNNLIGYADGTRDLIGIADEIGASMSDLVPLVKILLREKLLRKK